MLVGTSLKWNLTFSCVDIKLDDILKINSIVPNLTGTYQCILIVIFSSFCRNGIESKNKLAEEAIALIEK